jgi:hypothetical protein
MPARSEPAARERWTLVLCEMGPPPLVGFYCGVAGGGNERECDQPEGCPTVEVVPVSERDQWRKVAEELAVALKRRRFRHPEYPAGSHVNPGHDIIAEEREVEAAFLARFDALSAGEPGKEGE